MKNSIRVFFFGALMLTTAGNKILAQDTAQYKVLPPVTVTATTTKVPEKVWKSFGNYFTGAYDSRFYKINKDYLAKYMLNDQQNRALFTKRGNLVYHISYGYEKNLPEELRKQVKTSYYDYSITKAVKVTEADRLIWVVSLENDKRFLLVRLEDGEMEEVQQLDKK